MNQEIYADGISAIHCQVISYAGADYKTAHGGGSGQKDQWAG
jgi:hypothetical protein